MKPVDRQKMCVNCNGRVPIDADVCPYCTADLAEQNASEASPYFKNQSIQDSLTSLYTPPYASKTAEIPAEEKKASPAAQEEDQSAKGSFWALLLLSLGGILMTLGLLQFFFSDEGLLRLEWDSTYWYVLCIAAVPLFFVGIKKVNQLK